MKKGNYATSVNKRFVQELSFLNTRNKKITALPGPNIDLYSSILKRFGFTEMIFLEKDPNVFVRQISKVPKTGAVLLNDDILNHLQNDSFYDLDFCCSVDTIESYLPEINKIPEYTMTLSIRPVGEQKTRDILKSFENGGVYRYIKYRDTVPMLTIIKTKK